MSSKKKPLDKLNEWLTAYERRHSSSSNKKLTRAQAAARFAQLRGERIARGQDVNDLSDEERAYYHRQNLLMDPRLRYQQNREETWAHPSNLNKEHTEYIGCDNECIEGCPYIPEQGLETIDHRIAYYGNPEFDQLMQEWLEQAHELLRKDKEEEEKKNEVEQ
jgi:hypothetical protein